MTQRRVAVLIGGGIALVAALAVLTVAPVSVEKGKSTVSHIEASAGDGSRSCVSLTFDATFAYSVARPLIDAWGYSEVRDLTIDHVKVVGAPKTKCTGTVSPVSQVTSVVVLPNCDGGFSDAAFMVQSGRYSECDGNAVFYAAESEDGGQEVEMGWEGPLELPPSGLIRGPWCPDFGATAVASSGSAGATVESGDLCLDLS